MKAVSGAAPRAGRAGDVTESAWERLLAEAAPSDHIVQLYQDDEFLKSAVCHFTRTGLADGESVVLFPTGEHWDAMRRRLEADGVNLEAVQRRGQLRVLDAEEILPGIMRDDMPDPEEFATVVAELLADARADGRYPRVRIWGEIVDLLWKRGNVTASMSLEDLFDELVARKRECSIFCSFLMDNFDGDVHAQMLPRLGTNHSHLIPVEDYDRLQWAVSGALRDTVGAQEASVLEDRLLSRYRPPFNMPAAQALLLALRQFLPTLADPVLELSRTMYTRSGPSYAHAEQHAH